jgi:hypothetical protein
MGITLPPLFVLKRLRAIMAVWIRLSMAILRAQKFGRKIDRAA